MKKVFLALVLMLFVFGAFGVEVVKHDIVVTMSEDGSGNIEEEYWIRTSSEQGKALLNTTVESNEMDDWKEIGIQKTLKVPVEEMRIIPEVSESDIAIVVLQYRTNELVRQVETKGKKAVLALTEKEFRFYNGEKIKLPFSPPTELTVKMPSVLTLAEDVTPPPFKKRSEIIDGKKHDVFVWSYRQPFNAEHFRVSFTREVTIQSQISTEVLVKRTTEWFGTPINLLAVLIILGIAFWYRKQIFSLVSGAFAGEPTAHEEINHSE